MLCADLVGVCWKDAEGKTKKAQAVLEDISASGACLQLETPVPLGVVLRWGSPKKEFAGVVRYCVYREIGYFVGVQFDPNFRWSKAKFRPQHLLDLGRLIQPTEGSKPKIPRASAAKR
ncbi:MAG: PilZ domain-containing protein [Acidobacteriia bacterium]|nr:PilZ domain-containing protein [Terriglobia bacterium]